MPMGRTSARPAREHAFGAATVPLGSRIVSAQPASRNQWHSQVSLQPESNSVKGRSPHLFPGKLSQKPASTPPGKKKCPQLLEKQQVKAQHSQFLTRVTNPALAPHSHPAVPGGPATITISSHLPGHPPAPALWGSRS